MTSVILEWRQSHTDRGNVHDWVASSDLRRGHTVEIPSFLHQSDSPSQCLIDLSLLPWVGPATLAGLAAFVDRQARIGREIRFLRPNDAAVCNYLSRMGLPRVLDLLNVDHLLPSVNNDESLNEVVLVELNQFTSSEEVAQLVEIVHNNDLPDNLKSVVCRALLETGNNVPDHARVQYGYMAAQVTKGALNIAVADSGVGLLETLTGQGARSERQALTMAVSGSSESTASSAGRGLSSTREALKTHHGTGMLLSGSASLTISGLHDTTWSHRSSFEGTVFSAQLPLGSHS